MPFSESSPTSTNATAFDAERCVASPTSTVPGSAADCSREAVFTMSPMTMPSASPPTVAAASPVRTPARAAQVDPDVVPEARHRVDQFEAGAHGTLGVVLVRHRACPRPP